MEHDPSPQACSTERKQFTIYKAVPAQDYVTLPGGEDAVSVEILKQYHGIMLDEFSPHEVYGDGNCLYRAVSPGLYATQRYHAA